MSRTHLIQSQPWKREKDQKKVIFITGIGRSGSTLLDLMLGNGENSFSAGELYALFRPFRPHHLLQDGCFCEEPGCDFWQRIKEDGESDIYPNLFRFAEVRTLVDSSKHPLWLTDQYQYGRGRAYQIVPVIIYKSPLEFAYSLHKRDKFHRWRSMWMRRHRWLLEVADDFVGVSYRHLAQYPADVVEDLCERLGLEHFVGKEKFWENDASHFLFGSGSVKQSDRLVFYDEQFNEERLQKVRAEIEIDQKVEQVYHLLRVKSIWPPEEKDKRGVETTLPQKYAHVGDWHYRYERAKSTPWYAVNRLIESVAGQAKRLLFGAHDERET